MNENNKQNIRILIALVVFLTSTALFIQIIPPIQPIDVQEFIDGFTHAMIYLGIPAAVLLSGTALFIFIMDKRNND